MAKDLLLIALKRNLATAEELGQTDRAKALKKRIAVQEKAEAPKPEPEPAPKSEPKSVNITVNNLAAPNKGNK